MEKKCKHEWSSGSITWRKHPKGYEEPLIQTKCDKCGEELVLEWDTWWWQKRGNQKLEGIGLKNRGNQGV